MPKIRLNKAAKMFNISIDRAVEFINSKGFEMAKDPNAVVDESAFSALEVEFQKDGEQKKASNEVVISKAPEEKISLTEDKAPSEVIRAKAPKPATAPKILGTINPEPKAPAAAPAPEVVATPAAPEPVSSPEPEPKASTPTASKPQELKVLGKIELPKNESTKPKKSAPKSAAKATPAAPKPAQNSEPESSELKKDIPTPAAPAQVAPAKIETPAPTAPAQTPAAETPAVETPQDNTIETRYQKLEGPKILNEKIDLTQFQKPKKEFGGDKNKKKRKRITKDAPGTTPGATTTPKVVTPAVTGPKKELTLRPAGAAKTGPGSRGKKVGGRRNEKVAPTELSEVDVQKQIKETLEKLTNKGGKSKSAKHRKDKRVFRRDQAQDGENNGENEILKVTEFITVSELASLMDTAATEVISACFSLGLMVTMNQRLEADTLALVADEFGFTVEFTDADVEEIILEEEDKEEDLLFRAPIVTVMGHVDHGKTSLLDYIRKTNVIAGESGGITQHIGAYNVTLENGQRIAFLDTPGHEAFTAMRARGAQVTDIVIIVIAADDDVMPQTKEAISHAKAAGVPMIVAINKVDKVGANPDKIREQLSALDVLVEEWGGAVQCQEISAKFGNNVELLLEKVLLQAEMLELKANPNRKASGVVIEAALDKGKGYISTMMVQNGSLEVGDYILAGKNHGKVKALLDERGKNVKKVGPSTPVIILGLDGAPTAGDKFRIFADEREAKQLANKRGQLHREQSLRTKKHLTLDELGRRIALGDFKELNIILKGDVDGSVEALSDMLQRLSTAEIQINIILKGVGPITESDVLLASASDAIIIGFNVRPGNNAKDLADKEEIEIRHYSVIYDAIDEVKEAMEGMLSPEIKEQVVGNVEIRETFKISKVGTIAGCMVLTGKILRNSKIRLIRDGIVKFTGELESLKRFKDDAKEVLKGYECGLNIKGYNDIFINDILEVYEEVSVKKTLK
jgi:translation initiation factor IF-2